MVLRCSACFRPADFGAAAFARVAPNIQAGLSSRSSQSQKAGLPTEAAGNQTVRLRQGFGRQPSRLRREGWWAVTGSNRRPLRCKRSALPAELTALTEEH